MTQQQEVRHESLLQLYGSKELPLSAEHITKVAKRGGFDYSLTEVRDACFFLSGQGLAVRLENPGTGEIRYQITSAGMLHWENRES